jgi:PD-(D/E)XK endonuclease
MDHPKAKGDRTTLAVMLALREAGFAVSVPFGENTRYDLVIDDGKRLARVQCKTGRLREGAVLFAACSCYGHHRNPDTARRSYEGQIDLFAVHCQQNGRVYVIPIDDIQARVMVTLRVDPPRNGQRRKIRFAADYELAAVAVSATARPAASAGAG